MFGLKTFFFIWNQTCTSYTWSLLWKVISFRGDCLTEWCVAIFIFFFLFFFTGRRQKRKQCQYHFPFSRDQKGTDGRNGLKGREGSIPPFYWKRIWEWQLISSSYLWSTNELILMKSDYSPSSAPNSWLAEVHRINMLFHKYCACKFKGTCAFPFDILYLFFNMQTPLPSCPAKTTCLKMTGFWLW